MQVLHPRCCSLDIHQDTIVACVRLVIDVPGDPRLDPTRPSLVRPSVSTQSRPIDAVLSPQVAVATQHPSALHARDYLC